MQGMSESFHVLFFLAGLGGYLCECCMSEGCLADLKDAGVLAHDPLQF